MKNILFILINLFIINEIVFCQEFLFSSNLDSDKNPERFFNTYIYDLEKKELGHWIGVRFGGQVQPMNSKVDNWNFFEQWTLFSLYEFRFDRTFSLIAEYHLFSDRNVNYKRNLSAIEVGLKFRFQIMSNLKLATEAGLAIMQVPAFPFYYGFSIELKMNENTSISMNAKTNILPEFGYWLSTGVNYKIFGH